METRTTLRISRRGVAGFIAVSLASLALLTLLFVRLVSATNTAANAPAAPLVGHVAPDFTLRVWNGSAGQTIHLADLRGKPVVVNFWASWCAECVEEQPLLQSAWQKYQAQGVVVLGLAYNNQESDGLPFLRQRNVTYPCGVDAGGSAPTDYAVTGVPETVFINRAGVVVYKSTGPVDDGTLDREIQAILK